MARIFVTPAGRVRALPQEWLTEAPAQVQEIAHERARELARSREEHARRDERLDHGV